MRPTLTHHQPLDGCSAYRARFPCSAVYGEVVLKIAAPVYPIDARAVARNALLQRPADGLQQVSRLFCAQIPRVGQRVQFRFEQYFIGVNVAHPRQKTLVHQQWFELAFLTLQHGVKAFRIQLLPQRFRTQFSQFFLRVSQQPQPPELARVLKEEVIITLQGERHPVVLAQSIFEEIRSASLDAQVAAHAQVDQQVILRQDDDDVFSPPVDLLDVLPAHALFEFRRTRFGDRAFP